MLNPLLVSFHAHLPPLLLHDHYLVPEVFHSLPNPSSRNSELSFDLYDTIKLVPSAFNTTHTFQQVDDFFHACIPACTLCVALISSSILTSMPWQVPEVA